MTSLVLWVGSFYIITSIVYMGFYFSKMTSLMLWVCTFYIINKKTIIYMEFPFLNNNFFLVL